MQVTVPVREWAGAEGAIAAHMAMSMGIHSRAACLPCTVLALVQGLLWCWDDESDRFLPMASRFLYRGCLPRGRLVLAHRRSRFLCFVYSIIFMPLSQTFRQHAPLAWEWLQGL